jgi:hypothetical protein
VRRALTSLALALALCHGRAAQATPGQELEQARQEFRSARYADSIIVLSGLLYPQSRLADPAQLAEAHLLLGVAYFETGRLEPASRELESALFLDSTLTMDPNLFSPEAVKFFDKEKEELARKARDDAERARLAHEAQRLRQALANMVVLEKRRYFVNFIPFGAGQFQNGERGKGVFFFVSQAALGGASVSLYAYQVVKYGFRGRVPQDEVSGVRTIQTIQIATGAACLGLMAWGIIDSLSHYQHVVERELDPATKEEILKAGERPGAARLELVPTLGPGYAGAALSWEF